jgi:replication fork clamp-binding protein CrfC
VVVGSQSSGKSSVLENIVGRDFLPRGNNIVTRRPLVLQLHNTSATGECEDGKEWGEFDHLQGQRFYDFSEIKAEINRETDRLVGKGSSISSTPIYLRIHSPHIPTLTLVDLPGITKVPTGDQPMDIEKQIRKMIRHFIDNPNSIIVAVSTATEDIANSEALKIAREVDPKCSRTLGVVTKLDLMDQGTDAREVLENRIIPLHLGFVGVVNRSQRDINDGKPIKAALDAERAFFVNSPYSDMVSRMGTAYLTHRLSTLLLSHLQTHLPGIKQQISATVAETERELVSYGNPMGIDTASYQTMLHEATDGKDIDPSSIPRKLQGPILLDIMSKFTTHYTSALEGRSTGAFSDVATQQLYGGARIAFVFNEVFGARVDSIDPFDNLSDTEIRTAIRNATGPRPTLFLPEMAFEILVRKQIARLQLPVVECVDMVLDELMRVATQCQLGGLPQLARYVSKAH